MLRPQAEKKNIDLRTQYDSALPLVKQDAAKLRQILSNLLSNAIKFTPEGGRVLLKAQTEASDIVLTVTDTGVGIAPEDAEAIFEKAGVVRLYMLGKDEGRVLEVESQELTAHAKPDGGAESVTFTFTAQPQPGDAA